jgi:hypothetical protein
MKRKGFEDATTKDPLHRERGKHQQRTRMLWVMAESCPPYLETTLVEDVLERGRKEVLLGFGQLEGE